MAQPQRKEPETIMRLTKPFSTDRLRTAADAHGEPLILHLPDGEDVVEGEQDVKRFSLVANHLVMGRWIEIVSATKWGLMRVELLHMTAATTLKRLVLRDIIAPRALAGPMKPVEIVDEFSIDWNAHDRWRVLKNGEPQFTLINTEPEARAI